jgi:peptide/nickel transport system permease protein
VFAYTVRRLLLTIPLLFIALYLVHVGVSATTDPLAPFYLCLPRCQDGYDQIVEAYNLDVSIWVRPFIWFSDALQGDLGFSTSIGDPVTTVLADRAWNTALIAVPAFIIGSSVAVLLSVYSARHQYTFGDYFFTGLSFLGLAMPAFVLALLIQNIFGVQLENWFGIKPFNTGRKTGETPLEIARDVFLPAMSLAILGIAAESRFGRAAMLENLEQDYIRTARAKGLGERTIVWKHALRNAMIPLVTLWALSLSALLGGAVVTESIFSWPGLGTAFLRALNDVDLDLILGITLFTALVTILFNLLADIMYGVLDPRIRLD